jgi:hypothetical protein
MESAILSGIEEQKYSIAQNPKTQVIQLFKGEKDGGMGCYCPFTPPLLNQQGGLTRLGCDTACPHASVTKHGDKYQYKITCGGGERIYDCEVKADPHAANENMPRIHRI